MVLRLLLDEHVEHEALHRLERQGHDVEHVDLHNTLDKGESDQTLAQYLRSEERTIVTYDDDFVEFSESEYECVLLIEDEYMAAEEVADIVDRISEYYPQSELRGLQKVGREWL